MARDVLEIFNAFVAVETGSVRADPPYLAERLNQDNNGGISVIAVE